MAFISIGCAMLGFLSPANRGSMLTVTLLLFVRICVDECSAPKGVHWGWPAALAQSLNPASASREDAVLLPLNNQVLMGCIAGYSAAIVFKAFRGTQWKALTLLTAFLYPGITFVIFLVLNFFIWGQASSGAVPFGTMFALLCIWFLISFPLVWVGVWLGYRRELKDPPVKTNMVPRVIPSQVPPWHSTAQPRLSLAAHPFHGATHTTHSPHDIVPRAVPTTQPPPHTLAMVRAPPGVVPQFALHDDHRRHPAIRRRVHRAYFIMSSVWLQRFYYVFGFLAMVLFILLVGKRVESSRPDRECLQSPSRPHGHSLACVLYNLSGSSALSFR